jgi:hypothetical protein
MKYWIPRILALLIIPAAQAANYQLVHSPSLKLEVFIDNVKNSAPASWCAKSIPLRITSAQKTDAQVLTDFLPRVGTLVEKQCPKVAQLPWLLTDTQGNEIASGSAKKSQHWQPIIQPPKAKSPSGPAIPAEVAVTSPLATQDTISAFELPSGCQFRTSWNGEAGDSTLSVPGTDKLRCDSSGFLNGLGTIVLQQEGIPQTYNIAFYQGYPLLKIAPDDRPLNVASANAQRLILRAADSALVLPFNPQLHAWAFQGEVIIEMPREQAATQAEVDQKVAYARETWQPLINAQGMSLTFRLVETLAVERADPASGSYLSVKDDAH